METQARLLMYFTDLFWGGRERLWLIKNLEMKPCLIPVPGVNRKPQTFRKVWAAQWNPRVSSRSFPTLLWKRAGPSAGFISTDHLLGHTLASSGSTSVVILGLFFPQPCPSLSDYFFFTLLCTYWGCNQLRGDPSLGRTGEATHSRLFLRLWRKEPFCRWISLCTPFLEPFCRCISLCTPFLATRVTRSKRPCILVHPKLLKTNHKTPELSVRHGSV